MSRKKAKRFDEDEEPKAVKEMKKNKNSQINKEIKNSKKKKMTNKEKKRRRKKIILSIVALVILVLGIALGVSANRWTTLAVDMVSNESSIVIDSDGNTIAKLR